MKNLFTLCLLIAVFSPSVMLKAQSVLYYDFKNSLNEVNGNGPALTVLGNQGNYVIDTLSEIGGSNKLVYRFETNSGVQFNNTLASNFIGTGYSIELYFVFDQLSSWKRVVDWKNRKTDWGAYVYNGELNFYNIIYSSTAPVAAGEYTYYVITRDAETNEVKIYTDATEEIHFTDSNGDALIDGEGYLNFFQDDLIVPNEASSGAVAMLKLYNYSLDSGTIVNHWNQIGSNVLQVKEPVSPGKVQVYPNPAHESISVDLSAIRTGELIQLQIVDLNGRILVNKSIHPESASVTLPVNEFNEGIYLLRLETGGETRTSTFVIK